MRLRDRSTARAPRRRSKQPPDLEAMLAYQLKIAGFPHYETEQRLIPGRLFRCDFVFREQRVVVEVEGGIYDGRAHGSIRGILRDIEKHNEYVCHGWRPIRVTGKHIDDGRALAWIERALREAK